MILRSIGTCFREIGDPGGEPLSLAFGARGVNDSLSAFARDATLPSDPRVVYSGGNARMEHADLRGAAASMVA